MWPLYCVQSKKKTNPKLWCFEAKSRGSVRGKGLLPDVEAGTTKTWTAAAADLGRGTLLSFMVPCCLVTLLGGGAEAKLDLKHQPIFFLLLQFKASGAEQPGVSCCLPSPGEQTAPLFPTAPKSQCVPRGHFPYVALVVGALLWGEFHIIYLLKVARAP